MGIEKIIERNIDISITPTPKETAECFCLFDSMQQAEFFNTVALIVESWEEHNGTFDFQLNAISSEQMLTKKARNIMSKIGEYSAPF